MELTEAFEKAGKNESVQKLRGFFLCSCFASISADSQSDENVREWTLLYYNPGTKSVVDCFVNEKFVTVGEAMPAIKDMQELDILRANVPVGKAMSTATPKIKKKTLNTLISLHMKDINDKTYVAWTIAFVTADMSVTSIDIDASSGKLLKEETTRLIRKV